MKSHAKQFLIIIPLLLLAGVSFAAYTFAGPTSAPTADNTDAPLDVSTVNQVKNGGLSVDTFQARTGSDFAQQATFTGLVNGGTSGSTLSTINFGDSSHAVSINNTGNATVTGTVQSNSLKSGGGTKPLCADANGTVYMCGAASAPTNSAPVYLYGTYVTQQDGTTAVAARLSEPITNQMTVTIAASTMGGGTAVHVIKNMFTANAKSAGTCYYTATPTDIGTVTIYQDSTISWDTIPFPAGCIPESIKLTISNYNPQTSKGGRAIIAD